MVLSPFSMLLRLVVTSVLVMMSGLAMVVSGGLVMRRRSVVMFGRRVLIGHGCFLSQSCPLPPNPSRRGSFRTVTPPGAAHPVLGRWLIHGREGHHR